MTARQWTLAAAVALVCPQIADRAGSPRPPAHAPTRPRAQRAPLPSGDWAQMLRHIRASEYEVTRVAAADDAKARWQASNRRHGFRAFFDEDAVRIGPRRAGAPSSWETTFRLAAWGTPDAMRRLPAVGPEPRAEGQRIEYPREGVTEWWDNREAGLEHGFTLDAPPRPGAEEVRLEIAVGGGFEAKSSEDGATVRLRGAQCDLRYSGLVVQDADGRELPSRMHGEGDRIEIVADVSGASWPVTVDPTLTQDAKLLGAADPDGSTNDNMGWSVAVSGDTVVVGAYLDNAGVVADQGSAYVFVRSGTTWSVQQKLTAPDGAAGDNFGAAVAIAGDTVVVGADFDDVSGADQGSAYVFVRSGGAWSLQQKLTASDGAAGDNFGEAVAISGDTVVVGAYFDDVGGNTDQGSAYVFVRSGVTWTQQQKLTAADGAAADGFAVAVGVSGDTAVVGAWGDMVGGNDDQGSAYVFVRSGVVWTQQQKLTAADGVALDNFGVSVDVSGDTVVVGAYWDDVGPNIAQGSAYVFVRVLTVWTQQQKLTASDGAADDNFGWSVAISGETAIVGAYSDGVGANADQGSAYVFLRVGVLWTQQQKLVSADGAVNDSFGVFVAISGDTAVVGADWDDVGSNVDQGSAYVFTRILVTWTQQQKLTAADGAASDQFGWSVAISGDTAIVGAYTDDVGVNADQGSAYVFVRNAGAWGLQQKLVAADGAASDGFGFSVAIDGNTAIVGARDDDVIGGNQGSAYVFVRSGVTWTQQQKLTAADGVGGESFGVAVAVSGNTAVVGAMLDDTGPVLDQGAAYVFTRSGVVWTQQQQLLAPDGASGDSFGTAVAVAGDTALVGAWTDDAGANFDQGSAYVFTRSGVTWTPQQKLTASDGASNDHFGVSVALAADTAVVGAYLDNAGAGPFQGSAYAFVRNAGAWTQQQKLVASDGAANEWFGRSVALFGDTAVVGAPAVAAGGRGSAYAFLRTAGVWSEQAKLVASDGAASDFFGTSVAVDRDTAIAGAYQDDIGSNNDQGSAYVFTFTSLPPVVTSLSATPSYTSALVGADVVFGGSTSVTARGFVYSATNTAPTVGGGGVTNAPVPGTTGPMNTTLLGLAPGTLYYLQGYATNGNGTGYTGVGTFLTLTCPVITVAPASLATGVAGAAYAPVAFSASGGAPPYSFALVGTPPAGMTFAGNSLSGTPSAPGTFTFGVEATDLAGCTSLQNYTLVVLSAAASEAVRHLTVTSRDGQDLVEWLNPAAFGNARIRVNSGPTSCASPSHPLGFDGSTLVADVAGAPDAPARRLQGSLTNTHHYCYTVWIDEGGGVFSTGRTIEGRPFAVAAGPGTKWGHRTGIFTMVPPGNGVGVVYSVANDGSLHSMVKGPGPEGGAWPGPLASLPVWKPQSMNGPSQGRPSGVAVGTAGSTRTVFLSSQDGHVHAFDAETGAQAWISPLLAPPPDLQAPPSGVFTIFGGTRDLIFAGTRDPAGSKFYALRLVDGAPLAPGWVFDGTPFGKIGAINGQPAVDQVARRVYFASRAFNGANDKTVWCVELETGAPCSGWTPRAHGDIDTGVSLYGDRLLVGTNDDKVKAVDTSDGSEAWSFSLPGSEGPVKGYVAVDRLTGDAYFSTANKVWGLQSDGSQKWPGGGDVDYDSPSTPVYAPGDPYLYVGSGDGKLYRVSAADGSPVVAGIFPLVLGDGSAAVGSPTIDLFGGFLYVGTEDGVVYAVQLP